MIFKPSYWESEPDFEIEVETQNNHTKTFQTKIKDNRYDRYGEYDDDHIDQDY